MKLRLPSLLALGVALGLVGHKSDKIISSWEHTPIPWQRLARYVVGSILVMIMFVPLKSHLAKPDKQLIDEDIVSMILANCTVGFGVFCGYVVDGMREEKGN